MAFPNRLFGRRDFALPRFDLAPLEFSDVGPEQDELLLDRVVEAGESNVISLATPLPTAGELHAAIEHHLHATRAKARQPERRPGPAEELRSALAELRRSLG